MLWTKLQVQTNLPQVQRIKTVENAAEREIDLL